ERQREHHDENHEPRRERELMAAAAAQPRRTGPERHGAEPARARAMLDANGHTPLIGRNGAKLLPPEPAGGGGRVLHASRAGPDAGVAAWGRPHSLAISSPRSYPIVRPRCCRTRRMRSRPR